LFVLLFVLFFIGRFALSVRAVFEVWLLFVRLLFVRLLFTGRFALGGRSAVLLRLGEFAGR
jgi:hypothetical protein